MPRPFGNLPVPEFITNVRIMGIMRFVFCDSRNIGEIEFFDAGYFSFMETTLWNRKTRHRIAYRRIIPPGIINFPMGLKNNVTACRSLKRYTRIHTRLQRKIIHADFDFVGSVSARPARAGLRWIFPRRERQNSPPCFPIVFGGVVRHRTRRRRFCMAGWEPDLTIII